MAMHAVLREMSSLFSLLLVLSLSHPGKITLFSRWWEWQKSSHFSQVDSSNARPTHCTMTKNGEVVTWSRGTWWGCILDVVASAVVVDVVAGVVADVVADERRSKAKSWWRKESKPSTDEYDALWHRRQARWCKVIEATDDWAGSGGWSNESEEAATEPWVRLT